MTLSLGRTALTLALAAGLTFTTAGTASAEGLTVRDARGDVQAHDMQTEEPTGQAGVANGDIVRTVMRHNDRRISVRIKYVDLRKKVGDGRVDVVRVVTNEGVRRDAHVFAGPGMWRGEAGMSRPNGNPVDCGVKHKIDYDKNVTTLSFPRRCVSNPRWVRLGVGAMWMKSQASVYYADDAQIDGRVKANSLELSKRLRRG